LRVKIWLLVLGLVLSATGCAGGSSASSSATTTATQRPSSTAKLTIVSPTNGEVVKGPDVDVKVDLTGAKIVQATSTDLKPDEGHIHVSLDGQLVTMTSGTETTIHDVAPGHHVVQVDFVANDHGPFFPNVVAVTSFEVKG
jgi:hypothetical protein